MTTAGENNADPAQNAAAVAAAPAQHVPDSGIGKDYVGAFGITVMAVILLALLALAIYSLIAVWPASSVAAATSSRPFGIRLLLSRDQEVFVIVALTGAVGGLIHSARSMYVYVGNRLFRRSWLLMYLTLPFVASALAVIFYLVLRGGLIPGNSVQVNYYGFAAVAALVGLFSSQAVEKLKDVFSTILTSAKPGKDTLPPAAGGPVKGAGVAPAAGDTIPAGGAAAPGDTVPAEGAAPAEGTAPAEGAVPAEGAAPAEGAGPAEGDAGE